MLVTTSLRCVRRGRKNQLHREGLLTPALLRLDAMFDLLRNDRRFHKLAGSPT
jgi:hypothetical protein